MSEISFRRGSQRVSRENNGTGFYLSSIAVKLVQFATSLDKVLTDWRISTVNELNLTTNQQARV